MEQNRFRCHASVILENLGGMFWFIVLMLISSLDEYSDIILSLLAGDVTIFQALISMGVFFAFILIVLLYNWIVWSKTYISIDDEAIVVERNLLNRKVNTIGMKNISNINMEQNIFERIVGTYKIKLDTNSSTTANETDVKIVLSKEKALWFKKQVMLRMKEDTKEPVQTALEYDVEYTPKDIVMHCLYTASPIAVLFCVGVFAGCYISFRIINDNVSLMSAMINLLGGIFATVIVVGSIFQSLVKDFFVYYGFKARRQDNKIYLTHGLLKKRQYTIAVDKINGVKMVSPVVSRIFGRQYVQVICVGVGDEKNENSMLLLSEKTSDMEKKLALLLPEFVIQQPGLLSRHKNSMWKEVISMIIVILLFGTVSVLFGGINILGIPNMFWRILIFAVCVIIILYIFTGTFLQYKTSKIGLEDHNLLIVNGSFSKVSIWIPYSKIQKLDYTQGPLARHFGYAGGVVYILAATFDSIHTTSFFSQEVFEEIKKRMLVRRR